MGGREAELAQLGLMRQERAALDERLLEIEKKLKVEPVRGTDVRRPGGGQRA